MKRVREQREEAQKSHTQTSNGEMCEMVKKKMVKPR